MTPDTPKLWGGRFNVEPDSLVRKFNDSLPFDVRLYDEDITGSIAWTRGLGRADVLASDEVAQIVAGLEQVRAEFAAGQFKFVAGDEDIHTAVERRLIEIAGAVGGKLHTGRSRNDQVATDFRMWTMRACAEVGLQISSLQRALLDSADTHLHAPMPGYTHLQHAQPVTWGHWVLSHFWPLLRDAGRFDAARASAAVLPLGSGALAGTAMPIDRQALAAELGFDAVTENSIDAVADRDYAAEFLFAATMLALHLSRLSEQLILFSSAEFGFVALDDAYSTGSSLMPQKKNPDTLELTRGKAGRLIGNLTGLLATLKGLPSTYDKDLQEDKEPLFDARDMLTLALPVMAGAVRTLQVRTDRMAAQLEPGLLATDVADYLVRKGVPFRKAHHIVGQVVRLAENLQSPISRVPLADLQSISSHFDADVAAVFDFSASLASRAQAGGTAPQALQAQLAAARAKLAVPKK